MVDSILTAAVSSATSVHVEFFFQIGQATMWAPQNLSMCLKDPTGLTAPLDPVFNKKQTMSVQTALTALLSLHTSQWSEIVVVCLLYTHTERKVRDQASLRSFVHSPIRENCTWR